MHEDAAEADFVGEIARGERGGSRHSEPFVRSRSGSLVTLMPPGRTAAVLNYGLK